MKVKEKVKAADKIDPPDELVCDSKLKRWVWKNGYGIVFLLILSAINWGVTVIVHYL